MSLSCIAVLDIREFRGARKLKQWLRAGKTVELRDNSTLIACIVPERSRKSRRHKKLTALPDFAALRKEIFGDRIVPGSDLLAQERDRF